MKFRSLRVPNTHASISRAIAILAVFAAFSLPARATTPSAPTQCGTLLAGQGLTAGQTLTSCDTRFTLSMQTDGNLVLYMGGSALWASGTNGSSATYVIMQSDGNLVEYNNSGGAVWASGTSGNSGDYTYVQNDGNLVIYSSSNSALWASNTWGHTVPASSGCGTINDGQGLASGQSITSCDGRFTLTMQSDGNLVLYMGSSALWATGTSGKGGFEAYMQPDGNFVVYTLTNAIWASGTNGNSGDHITAQTDGNLVIYSSSGSPLWASNTCCHPASSSNYFAPYDDLGLAVDQNPPSQASSAGLKAITLGFLISGGSCSVGWGGLGGTLPTDTNYNGVTVSSQVSTMQSSGVTVIISLGGASGVDAAGDCSSASALQSVYQQVINQYHVSMLDFDIEGGAVTNSSAITQRDQALAGLKAANPGLIVSFTLPVMPTGLTSSGVNVLNDAKSNGLALDVVNVMAMDYGSCCDNGGAMGTDAEDAANSTHSQVGSAGLSSTIGITPMIGQNDTAGEVFQLSDANTVLNFANSNSWVSRIGMWELSRDNGGCPGQTSPSTSCSGISQNTWQFSQTFEPF